MFQVSLMSFFEIYRMNIPILAPSKALLVTWHLERKILNELTWDAVQGKPSRKSKLPPHPSHAAWPDPNLDNDRASLEFWFEFADIYQFPHVVYFDSIDDLLRKTEALTKSKEGWQHISNRMRDYNKEQLSDLENKWRTNFIPRMFASQRHSRHSNAALSMTYKDAAQTAWPGLPNPCY